MAHDKLSELRSGFETAFVDGAVASNLAYKPQFISNNYRQGSFESSRVIGRYPGS